jgi:adenosine deaminase
MFVEVLLLYVIARSQVVACVAPTSNVRSSAMLLLPTAKFENYNAGAASFGLESMPDFRNIN